MSKKAKLLCFGKRETPCTEDVETNDAPTEVDYDDFEGEDAPNSLFQQVRDAKTTSSTPLQFFRKTHGIFQSSVLCTILVTLWPAFPVSMIVMGATFLHDCPLEPKIPVYLLASGACYFPRTLLDAIAQYRRTWHGEEEKSTLYRVIVVLRRVQLCCLFLFMIVGNVWVYSNYPPSDDRDSSDYCYGPLYYFAFWLMTGTYIAIALGCLCVVGIVLYLFGSVVLFEEKT